MPRKPLSGRAGQKFGAVDDSSLSKVTAAARKGKGAGRGGRNGPASKAGKSKLTVAELCAKAQQYADELQPEMALQFYKKALEQEPSNPDLLDAAGVLYIEQLGEIERGRQMFMRSVEVAPDASASKWMYLAQTEEDARAAVASYERGLALLKAKRESLAAVAAVGGVDDAAVDDDDDSLSQTPAQELAQVNQQIVSGYCGIAEQFLTDLCDEPEAETRCEQCLAEALAADGNAVETLYLLGNLRLCQNRRAEAEDAVKKLAVALLRRLAGGDDGSDSEEEEEDYDEDDSGDLPPLAMRVSIAKLMLEVGQAGAATLVLERCLLDDDSNPEVWFLIAAAYRDSRRLATARQYLSMLHENVTRAIEEGHDVDGNLRSLADEAAAAMALIPEDAVDADDDASEAVAAAAAAPDADVDVE